VKPCPLWREGLLTFAPATIGQAVGPPGAFGVVLLGHLEVMPATPALWYWWGGRCGAGGWCARRWSWLCRWELAQELAHAQEQLLFVVSPERHLHLVAADRHVGIHRGRCFAVGRRGARCGWAEAGGQCHALLNALLDALLLGDGSGEPAWVPFVAPGAP